jgi:hypothetical protein
VRRATNGKKFPCGKLAKSAGFLTFTGEQNMDEFLRA